MTSCMPYSESYNMKHMTHIRDIRGPNVRFSDSNSKQSRGELKINQSSIMGTIANNPNFSKFRYILKLSNLQGIYNDPQANFTLFVPSDKELSKIPEGVFTNMDDATARHIVHSSTLRNRITSTLLEDSPASYFVTMSRINKLFITNINGETLINNSLKVIEKNIECNNGLIHVVDGLLWPTMI